MNYSEAEFDKAYKKIIRRIIKSKSPVNDPMAYILGGQPGAGKTGLQRNLMVENSNIIIINADAYRNSHPRFNEIQAEFGTLAQRHTQPFINEVVEKLISDLSDMKYSLVIEGTLRTAEIPLNTCRMLKNKGYSVELHIISVKKEISYESTIYRYENNLELGMVPRATAKEDHDNVVDAICDNLDIIYEQNAFDDIKLFDREGNNLYTAKCGVAPSLVEKDKLFGYWSDSEITSYRKIIDDIIALKRSRNAPDLAKYILESSIKFAYAKSRIEKLNK